MDQYSWSTHPLLFSVYLVELTSKFVHISGEAKAQAAYLLPVVKGKRFVFPSSATASWYAWLGRMLKMRR
jgi:hypothetical protein